MLQRLQLQNRNDYLCVGGSTRSMQATLNPGTYFYLIQYKIGQTTTTCSIMIYNLNQTAFSALKTNILAFSRTLLDKKLVMFSTFTNSGDVSCPACDGRPSILTCPCNKNMANGFLPSANYKIFPFLIRHEFTPASNAALTPYYKLQAQILTVNMIQFTITVEYIQNQFYYIQVIFINEDLFDTTQKKSLMFSYAMFEHPSNTISPYFFSIPFPHYVSDSNIFIGLLSQKGIQYSFNLELNTPLDTNLIGTSSVIGNAIKIFALAFYGFVQQCPSYLTMSCQPCPTHCKTCNVWSTFHCVQCNSGFILSPDKQSCFCPLIIVGQFCDNFPSGCSVTQMSLVSGMPVCLKCDFTKKLNLVGNDCKCQSGYTFDVNNVCKDFCGDGIVLESECDDGNIFSGDGCSSTCQFETGFTVDQTTIPASFRSEILLRYEVSSILKHETQNSAKIFLVPANAQKLPFTVKKEQFQPISDTIIFKLIISENPYQQVVITDFFITEVNENNEMTIQFAFDSNVQGLQSQITLNYKNTQYKNDTQKLSVKLQGDNYALKVTKNSAAYKGIGYAMLVGIILNVISLLIGFLTSKFIGLESILTLQLIYFSQLLIFDISRWPSGFVFLKNLKYASGYNEIFQYTDLNLYSSIAKKINTLGIKKLIIENFNLSFLILSICFFCVVIVSIVRKSRQSSINEQFRQMKQNKEGKNIQVLVQTTETQLYRLNKVNQISFWIANQICLWFTLPLLSAVSAEFMIPNNQFNFTEGHFKDQFFVQVRGLILLLSLLMIFCVVLNNFKNIWLSLSSHNQLMQRPQEITYKNLLFVYLFAVGLMIFFFNCTKFGSVYISTMVLILQILFVVALMKIQPYKQSLKVHTVVLFINNGMVLVFLLVINLLNYVQDLDETFVLSLGFFLTGGTFLSLALTFVRFYYELRYGKQLEEKIMEEKEQQRLKKQQQKQLKLKNYEQKLQKETLLKKTQQQKIRDRNMYLYENQHNQEIKLEQFEWLEKRNWDQKMKDKEYFKKFDEKPLYYLKMHDQEKYDKKIKEIEESRKEQQQRLKRQMSDPQHQLIIKKLRKEIQKIKKGKSNF